MSDIVERLRQWSRVLGFDARRDVNEAADTIAALRAEVAGIKAERDAMLKLNMDLRAEVKELRDPKLSHMRLENGQLDMALISPVIEGLATAMGGWFVAGGAKNYAEMRLHDRHETGAVYIVTVQKSGAKTPHDCRREAEAELATLRAEVEKLTGERDRQYDENVSLIATNERLRAALGKINVGEGWAAQIARSALEKPHDR